MVKVSAMLTNEEYAIYSNICKILGLKPNELAKLIIRWGMLYMDNVLKNGLDAADPDQEDQ